MTSTATKAIEIIKGCVAIVKLGYELNLGKDLVIVVDPRKLLDTEGLRGFAGVMVYREDRSGRSWSDMLHSTVTNMGPVLDADKEAGLVTSEQRAEHDVCPVHGPDCPDRGGFPGEDIFSDEVPMDPAAYNPFNKQPPGDA